MPRVITSSLGGLTLPRSVVELVFDTKAGAGGLGRGCARGRVGAGADLCARREIEELWIGATDFVDLDEREPAGAVRSAGTVATAAVRESASVVNTSSS